MPVSQAKKLRKNIRFTQNRLHELCAKQIPGEIFHYTLSQMRTINSLYSITRDFPGGVQLKVLAERLGITPAATSEMVDTLVRKGAILRTNDPKDRRAVLLQVGEELAKHFEACEKQLNLLTQKFLDTLEQDEVDSAIRISAKFADFVSGIASFAPEAES